MSQISERYFNPKLPVEEQMFNLALFLCIGGFAYSVAFDILMNLSSSTLVIHVVTLVMAALLFLVHKRLTNRKLWLWCLIMHISLFVFPCIYILEKDLCSEVPLYFLLGIAYSAIFLDGIYLRVTLVLEVIVYSGSMYYVIVVANHERIRDISYGVIDYVRVGMAFVITGTVCAMIISYRNRVLLYEMKNSNEASNNAQYVNFAKDMFLVNVSHDIRTPLNAIIGTTELVYDATSNDYIKENTYHILNASHALLSITNDLLDFSRMKEDKIVLAEKEYEIDRVLDDIINMISIRLLDTNIELYTDIDPEIPRTLFGDSDKVRQIFINILGNAVKYTKSGCIHLRVTFEKVDENKIKLIASVEDTGIGMKPEVLANIFEPFCRAGEETDRSIEGCGLGLALCKRMISAMNGSMKAESQFGIGSTFTFEICQRVESYAPVVIVYPRLIHLLVYEKNRTFSEAFEKVAKAFHVNADYAYNDNEFYSFLTTREYSNVFVASENYEYFSEQIKQSINHETLILLNYTSQSYLNTNAMFVCARPVNCLNIGAILNGNSNYAIRKVVYKGTFTCPQAHILVVDDNLVNLEVAIGILNRYQCRVMTVTSGRECLNILKREYFDLVLLDYMMPEMDGIDTLKKIRELPLEYTKYLPVISVTANAVSGAKEMFLHAGFDDYISKPIEIERFEEVLKKFLPKNYIIWK